MRSWPLPRRRLPFPLPLPGVAPKTPGSRGSLLDRPSASDRRGLSVPGLAQAGGHQPELAGGDARLRDLLRVELRNVRGAGLRLPEHLVRGPAGLPGDQHPLRGPDPLSLEEAADGIRDHARRAADPDLRLVLQLQDGRRGDGRDARGGAREPAGPAGNDPVIRSGRSIRTPRSPGANYDLPFKPGPFPWGEGQAHLQRPVRPGPELALGRQRCPVPSPDGEMLSQPGDPFKLVVQEAPARLGRRGRSTRPTPRATRWPSSSSSSRPRECPRRATPSPTEDEQWFKLDRRFYRVARSECAGPGHVRLRRSARARRRLPQAADESRPARRGAVPLSRQIGQDPGLRPALWRARGQVDHRCPRAT